jgi:hypothetical protein
MIFIHYVGFYYLYTKVYKIVIMHYLVKILAIPIPALAIRKAHPNGFHMLVIPLAVNAVSTPATPA